MLRTKASEILWTLGRSLARLIGSNLALQPIPLRFTLFTLLRNPNLLMIIDVMDGVGQIRLQFDTRMSKLLDTLCVSKGGLWQFWIETIHLLLARASWNRPGGAHEPMLARRPRRQCQIFPTLSIQSLRVQGQNCTFQSVLWYGSRGGEDYQEAYNIVKKVDTCRSETEAK